MPTIVPGEGELFCCPYVVGIILGLLLAVCREIRRVRSPVSFEGEDRWTFLLWKIVEIGCKIVVVLEATKAECATSLGNVETPENSEIGIGAMFDDEPASDITLEA